MVHGVGGWVGLEIVGTPIKSNKKNVKKGNLSVNNIFYQNDLSIEFCTIWWKVVSCICPAFCNLKLLGYFFKEMLNILMTKVHVVLYRIAMRAMSKSVSWLNSAIKEFCLSSTGPKSVTLLAESLWSFLDKSGKRKQRFLPLPDLSRKIEGDSVHRVKSVKVAQKANFVILMKIKITGKRNQTPWGLL